MPNFAGTVYPFGVYLSFLAFLMKLLLHKNISLMNDSVNSLV